MTNNQPIPIPQPSDKIYVQTSAYIGHGVDDFIGGIATVKEVKEGISGGESTPFVTIVERPGIQYNWPYLYEQQEKLKEQFGEQIAHECPDERPEFNDALSLILYKMSKE